MLLKPHTRYIELTALEAGCGVLLTRSLRKLGYRVAMFDSRQASRFRAIRNDAKGLANIAHLGPKLGLLKSESKVLNAGGSGHFSRTPKAHVAHCHRRNDAFAPSSEREQVEEILIRRLS